MYVFFVVFGFFSEIAVLMYSGKHGEVQGTVVNARSLWGNNRNLKTIWFVSRSFFLFVCENGENGDFFTIYLV